jgi:hypothetical protein
VQFLIPDKSASMQQPFAGKHTNWNQSIGNENYKEDLCPVNIVLK